MNKEFASTSIQTKTGINVIRKRHVSVHKIDAWKWEICWVAVMSTELRNRTTPQSRSLNALVTESKYCPFAFNTTIELKYITTTFDNKFIQRGMFELTCVPVLSDVFVICLSSIVVLTPNGSF